MSLAHAGVFTAKNIYKRHQKEGIKGKGRKEGKKMEKSEKAQKKVREYKTNKQQQNQQRNKTTTTATTEIQSDVMNETNKHVIMVS